MRNTMLFFKLVGKVFPIEIFGLCWGYSSGMVNSMIRKSSAYGKVSGFAGGTETSNVKRSLSIIRQTLELVLVNDLE